MFRKRMMAVAIVLSLVASILLPMDCKAEEAARPAGLQQPKITYVDASQVGKVYEGEGRKLAANGYWDKYASSYYYSQMNTQQKNLYNNLYNICNQYLSGNADIEETDGYYYTQAVAYNGISQETAEKVALVFAYSNPQFYFLEVSRLQFSMMSTTQGTVQMDIYPLFANGAERAEATASMKTKIDEWMSQINGMGTALEKERKAHDLIVANTSYAADRFDQSCYSTFINGTTVCAGYAEAFELLCRGAGIQCIVVTSLDHEWNQIQYNGVWYAVDVTWNDTAGTDDYYNITEVQLKQGNSSHNPEEFWTGFNRPVCALPESKPKPQPQYKATDVTVYNGVDYRAVFNATYYGARYTDLRKAFGNDGNKLLQHFVNNGIYEGRQACNNFSIQSYRNRYPDLRNVYGSNTKGYVMHYINSGQRERRIATGCDNVVLRAKTTYKGVNYAHVYDFNYYIKKNKDVLKAFGYDENKVLAHFVNNGMNEGRVAKESFNVKRYQARYSDLQRAFGNQLKRYYLHYISNGVKEGRIAK